MIKIIIPLLILAICSCVEPKANIGNYYDLEAELDNQIVVLSGRNYQLKKTVRIAEANESHTFDPDSTDWKKHLDILKKFSPAIPSLVGSFEINRVGESEVYTLKENAKSDLKYFSIVSSGSNMVIEGTVLESRTIYEDFRKVEILFEDKILSKFKLEGYQKMILKDTIYYTIEAEVIK